MTKIAKQSSWKRRIFARNDAGQLNIYMERDEAEPHTIPILYPKINSKWNVDLL